MRALERARREMETITAELRIKTALRYRSSRLEIVDLNPGDPLLINRERSRKWEGPYKFLAQDGKIVTVESATGKRQDFSTTVVKHYRCGSTLLSSVYDTFKPISRAGSDFREDGGDQHISKTYITVDVDV